MSTETDGKSSLWKNSTVVAALIALGGVVISVAASRSLTSVQIRQIKAAADKLEADNKQAERPVIQLTPEIKQTASMQDIREIRVELLLENKGNRDATIHHVETSVDNGRTTGDADKAVMDTQNFYYERLEFADNNQTAPLAAAPYSTETATEQNLFSPDPPPLEEPAASPSMPEKQASYEVSEAKDATRQLDPSRGLSRHLGPQIPAHQNCPHGKMIALSGTSPDVKWELIPKAKQSVDNGYVLRPSQSTSHTFRYLLTEHPLQQHFKWYKFKIVVKYAAEATPKKIEKREYECIIPGLNSCPDCVYRSVASARYPTAPDEGGGSVWKPIAPLMPVESSGD